MSFSLSDEQKEFQSVLRSFFLENITSEYLRSRISSAPSRDAALWKKLSELGLPDSFGGSDEMGVGFRELSLLAFECGQALVPEALIESAFFGAYFASRLLGKEEKASAEKVLGQPLIAELASGACAPGVALVSLPTKLNVENGHCTGSVPLVVGSPESKVFFVLERTSAAGGRILVVNVHQESEWTTKTLPLLDPTMRGYAAELRKAPCAQITGSAAERALQLFHTLRAIEMAGVCSRAIEMTVEFVKTREQFGVPVGGFQAVQHRLADMYLQSEALGAIARFASWAADSSPEQLPLASASALSQAVDQASGIVEGAIQLHGGIGFTYEYDLHFFLRRAKCLEALLRYTEDELGSLVALAA
jgi:alkylation response protein AidB-like acyl-CoA dehydrogenase